MVRYRPGSPSAGGGSRTPQQDIAAWVAADPDRAAEKVEGDASAAFFGRWVGDPANAAKAADLEPVPADMVTTSGSGLDPHITVRNALSAYQLDRVAKARGVPPGKVAEVVRAKAFTPLSGLVGEPLVNVLELNLELDARFPVKK
jgi:K+-transporting ATPase ATPase C chain